MCALAPREKACVTVLRTMRPTAFAAHTAPKGRLTVPWTVPSPARIGWGYVKVPGAPGPRCQNVKYIPVKFSAHRGPPPSLSKRGGRRAPRASLALARRRASALNRPKTRPTAAKRDRTPEPPPCSFSVVRSTPTASLENRASSRAPSPCTLRASRSTSAHAQCPQRLGPGSQASHGPTAVHAPHNACVLRSPDPQKTAPS